VVKSLLFFTTNNKIEKNILKKIPTQSPITITCHYMNSSFLQLEEFITA
jgi:hypothetical protein